MEDLYKRLLDFTKDGIYRYSYDEGRIMVANKGFVEILDLGSDPSVVAGKLLKEVYIYVEKERTVRNLLDKQGEVHGLEYHFKTLKGEDRWVFHDAYIIIDQATKKKMVECVIRNVTEHKLAEEAIKASELNYHAIFETVNDAILIQDIETANVVDVNQKACEMYCYSSKEEMMGQNILALSAGEAPYDYERAMQHIGKAVSGEAQLYEWIAKDKVGRFFWVEVSLKRAVIRGKYRLLAVIRDITERKQTEERLNKINEVFLNFGPDPAANITRLTALCGELLGADCSIYNKLEDGKLHACGTWNVPEDFIGIDNPEGHICYDVIMKKSDDAVVIRDLSQTHYAESDPNIVLYKLQTYVGHSVKFSNTYIGSLCALYQFDFSPSDQDKKILGVIASAIGVEERRRSEEKALLDSEARYRTLAESAQDFIFMVDTEMRIQYMNNHSLKWIEKESADIIGKKLEGVFAGSSAEVQKQDIQKVFKTGKSILVEREINAGDNKIWTSAQLVPLKDSEGRINGVLGIARDISHRKDTEEQLIRRDYQLEILTRTSQHINAILEIPIILRTLVAAAIEIVGGNAGAAGLLTGQKMVFTEYNRAGKVEKIDYSFDMEHGVPGWVMKNKQPYISNDAAHDPHVVSDIQKKLGFYNLVDVPILNRKGELIGCIEIHNKEGGRHFDAEDVFMLQGMAASAAVALDNARMLIERKRDEEVVKAERDKAQRYLDIIGVIMVALNDKGEVILINKKGCTILGYKQEDILGKDWFENFIPAKDRKKTRAAFDGLMSGETRPAEYFENPILTKSGEERAILWHNTILRREDGKVVSTLSSGEDVTEHKWAEKEHQKLNKEILKTNQKLKKLALKDPQTGLFNHLYMTEVLEAELYRARRYGNHISIVMLDIDYFKSINDVYGHDFGDTILTQFAVHIKKLVRRYDIVIRYGGEEFVIICPGTDRSKGMLLAQRLLDAVGLYSFGDDKRTVKLKMSIAVSAYPEDKVTRGMDIINLLERIIEKVKDDGGNLVCCSTDLIKRKKNAIPAGEVEPEDIRFLKERIEKLTKKGKQNLVESIFAFAKTIELRDHYTGQHVENTVHFATEIAKELNLSEEDRDNVRQAAVLHDLGKIGISDKILHKKGKLSDNEFEEIKKHPQIAADIIRPVQFMHDIIPLVLYHHEKWDGKGYPAGLKGEEIPVGARIIAIADVYQALTSDRSYRKAYTQEEALNIIKEGAGSQFDPKIVGAFLKIMSTKRKKK